VDCKDTKVLYPLGAVNVAALKQAVNGLRPGGYTPIAYALEKAGAGLARGGNNSLVLVTDGIESCQGDPCAVSARLAFQGIVTGSFVVGLGLGLDKGQFFSCIGRYYPVSDRAGLTQALQGVMQQSLKPVSGRVTIYRAGDRKEVVAQGSLNEKPIFPAGTYDVLLRVGGKNITWPSVRIDADLTGPIGEQPVLR
jgi:Ca-activated chloride channel family protein